MPWFCNWTDCSRLEQDFPMKQLKIIKIGPGFQCSDFSLKNAVNLEELRIGETGSYYIARSSKLGNVDLSANKKLKGYGSRASVFLPLTCGRIRRLRR